MLILELCEKYGWDYYTYLNQPSWFLELAKIKYSLDNQKLARANKKYGRK